MKATNHGRRPALFVLWLACAASIAGGVEEVRIDDPRGFWSERDFGGMVPSIHLPTTHAADDLIHVWLWVPPDRRIDAVYVSDQQRWSPVFPPGTRSDRVEYYRIDGPPPDSEGMFLPSDPRARANWTVADVRGTEILEQAQRFHVLRPVSGQPHAALRGWSWRRGDAPAQTTATDRLLEFVAEVARPAGDAPMGPRDRRQLARFNDCAECHTPGKARSLWDDETVAIKRRTDVHGFFVPQAVLSDECVVANHRARDLNAEDPFVDVRCGDAPAELQKRNGGEAYVCRDGRTPVGYRDVRAGLAAGHEYTQRMCASRRWLYERMTQEARGAFADAFAACGIPPHQADPAPRGMGSSSLHHQSDR